MGYHIPISQEPCERKRSRGKVEQQSMKQVANCSMCTLELKIMIRLLSKTRLKKLTRVLFHSFIHPLIHLFCAKAMIFQVVTYRCESWAIQKAAHRRTDTSELWC